MKISQIKDKELQKLARSLVDPEYEYYDPTLPGHLQDLTNSFDWNDTEQGVDFWSEVDDGEITDLSNHPQYKQDPPPESLVEAVEAYNKEIKEKTIDEILDESWPKIKSKLKSKLENYLEMVIDKLDEFDV